MKSQTPFCLNRLAAYIRRETIAATTLPEGVSANANNPMSIATRGFVTAAMALTFWATGTNRADAGLTGTGPHLTGPISGPSTIPISFPTFTGPNTGPFTGTWASSVPGAPAAWQGTYAGTGPFTDGGAPAGFTTLNFTNMANGVLPMGSYIVLGDLDGGSTTNETFTLKAFGPGGVPILPLMGWLDTAASIYGTGAGSGGIPAATDTPGWTYTAGTGTYFFDGTTVPGNPSVAVLLPTLTPIVTLEVTRTSNFANLYIAAPVPEPGTALFGVACVGAVAFRRRKR